MKLFVGRSLSLALLLGSAQACAPLFPPTAAPATVLPRVLPQPLYYLGADCQIWRMEPDGATRGQITHETVPVDDFDVSPVGGGLAYAAGNALVYAGAEGAGRRVLIAGLPLPPDSNLGRLNRRAYLQARLSSPRWSPEGTHIAFIQNGINWISGAGGEPEPLLPNPEVPVSVSYETSFETPLPGGNWISYRLNAWAPDGTRLLLQGYDFPIPDAEDFRLAVLNVGERSLKRFEKLYAEWDLSWSADSEFVYVAGQYGGTGRPGFWRVTASTGQFADLLPEPGGENYALVAAPYQPQGGQLYFFMAQVDTLAALPAGQFPLGMYRAGLDSAGARTALRADGHTVHAALWAPDGSGAVVMEMVEADLRVPRAFTWLPVGGGPAVQLAVPVAGCAPVLHWGLR